MEWHGEARLFGAVRRHADRIAAIKEIDHHLAAAHSRSHRAWCSVVNWLMGPGSGILRHWDGLLIGTIITGFVRRDFHDTPAAAPGTTRR